MSANRNKESVTADLKSDEGKTLLRRLVRTGRRLLENFRPGVLDRLGFSVDELACDQPAAGGAVDHRIRPRRARGRPRRLRPDRTGRGRPDDPHRERTARADEGRRPDRRPARRDVRRLRRRGRAARARAHRTGPRWSAPACWPRSSACTPTRAPGGPSRARCRPRSATTTRRSRRTACSTPPMRRSRWPAAARGCGAPSRLSSASTRTTGASPPTGRASSVARS